MLKETVVACLLFLWLHVLASRSAQAQIPEVEQVSLLQLIASPEKFNGKVVQVIGFLRLEFEGNMLYLHKEDYQHRICKNSLWVVRNSKVDEKARDLNMHYVIIVGTFDAEHKGHQASTSGTITNIKAVDLWPIPPKRR